MMYIAWPRTHIFAMLLATLGVSGIAWAGSDIYIPRTSVHFKCRFPDGSYTEYKEREKWYFYAEPFPHAQTRGSLDASIKYVDTNGKTHPHVGTSDDRCVGVGKRDGRLFFNDGFQNLKGQFVHFTEANQVKGAISPRWENFPKEIPMSYNQNPEVRSFMRKEYLYAGYRAQVVATNNEQTLLYEQPLTPLKHPSIPFDTVLYVYQSISTDYGKTWSTPIITKEAKLFEIGRLLTEQSWSPKVETLVKHR